MRQCASRLKQLFDGSLPVYDMVRKTTYVFRLWGFASSGACKIQCSCCNPWILVMHISLLSSPKFQADPRSAPAAKMISRDFCCLTLALRSKSCKSILNAGSVPLSEWTKIRWRPIVCSFKNIRYCRIALFALLITIMKATR